MMAGAWNCRWTKSVQANISFPTLFLLDLTKESTSAGCKSENRCSMYFPGLEWGLVDVTVAPDLSLERTLYPSTSSLPGRGQSSPPGNVTPEILGSWWCAYCESSHGACHSWAGKSSNTSSVCLDLCFCLGRENTEFWKKGMLLGLMRVLAQRSSLGGLQRHHPREPRGWGCAEP